MLVLKQFPQVLAKFHGILLKSRFEEFLKKSDSSYEKKIANSIPTREKHAKVAVV